MSNTATRTALVAKAAADFPTLENYVDVTFQTEVVSNFRPSIAISPIRIFGVLGVAKDTDDTWNTATAALTILLLDRGYELGDVSPNKLHVGINF